MRIIKSLIALLFLLITLSGCDKELAPNIDGSKTAEKATLLNEEYGKDLLQKVDIYLPANRSTQKTKVLILIHGGAWLQGNKEEMNPLVEALQPHLGSDYAIVNMNYRLVNPLVPRYMIPTQPEDVGNVVDYIEKYADVLGVKPQFVTMGVSAGAHLAMYYAYKHDDKGRVKAVVNIVGPNDLTDATYSNEPLFSLGMRFIAKSKDIPSGYSAEEYASPITWVELHPKPTITFGGETDHLVPVLQHFKLADKLSSLHVYNEIYLYESGHMFFEKVDEAFKDVVSKTAKFLKQM